MPSNYAAILANAVNLPEDSILAKAFARHLEQEEKRINKTPEITNILSKINTKQVVKKSDK